VQMMGGNAEVHPRSFASPLGYRTANNVATAWGVATRSAVARFPEAQYPTSALAAASAVGWGAGGITGAAVVGTGTVVDGVEAGGMVWSVVDVAAEVVGWVGWVVGAAALELAHADAITPSTQTIAAARTDRESKGVTIPF
jgi:hypothetical protein